MKNIGVRDVDQYVFDTVWYVPRNYFIILFILKVCSIQYFLDPLLDMD